MLDHVIGEHFSLAVLVYVMFSSSITSCALLFFFVAMFMYWFYRQSLCNLADSYVVKGDFEQAIKQYSRACEYSTSKTPKTTLLWICIKIIEVRKNI